MTQSGYAGRMDGGVGPADWRLTEDVQLWVFGAVAPGHLWELCLATLAEQERVRAMRMRPGTPRDEFVTGRAAVRGLLGAALGIRPQALNITVGRQGKLTVEGAAFNVAHARGLIGVALCAQGRCELDQLGLDLEHVDAGKGWREIADAHFTQAERNSIAGSEDPERRFCEIWTHKEAAVKATGAGLGAELADFDVSGVPTTGYGEVVLGGQTVYLRAVDFRAGELRPVGLQAEGAGHLWCCSVGRVGAPPVVRVRGLDHTALAGLLR